MKKKLVSALLCATMAASLLAGCGSGDTSDTGSSGKKGDAKTEVTNDGKILNIYCWNDEFQSRITDHYPDYKKVDATHGKIGDIDVVWNITPSENNAYQNNLDETLLKQADASADDKIDLFLVEADYAPKYVDSDYTMPIKDLGITDSDISKQYKYTQDVVTDSEGNLKGLSWQGLSLIEAARIDGSGEFRTFNHIVLPLMKPAIAVQAIFSFVSSWNNYFTPALILHENNKKTLPILLAQLRSADFLKFDMGKVYMMITFSILPVIVVYLILSKHIVGGVAMGSVKG